MRRSPVVEVVLPMAERVKLLIAEYPHLIEHPATLKQLLSQLVPKYGKGKIQAWYNLIDAQQWPEFVEAILEAHYDPTYRRSLPRHFRQPQQTIHLNGLNAADIQSFIKTLGSR